MNSGLKAPSGALHSLAFAGLELDYQFAEEILVRRTLASHSGMDGVLVRIAALPHCRRVGISFAYGAQTPTP